MTYITNKKIKNKDDNIHKKRSTKIGDKPKNSMTDKLMPQVNYILNAHQLDESSRKISAVYLE